MKLIFKTIFLLSILTASTIQAQDNKELQKMADVPFFIKVKWAALEMKGNVRQATCMIGQGTLALARKADGALWLPVKDFETRHGVTCPFNQSATFFS